MPYSSPSLHIFFFWNPLVRREEKKKNSLHLTRESHFSSFAPLGAQQRAALPRRRSISGRGKTEYLTFHHVFCMISEPEAADLLPLKASVSVRVRFDGDPSEITAHLSPEIFPFLPLSMHYWP